VKEQLLRASPGNPQWWRIAAYLVGPAAVLVGLAAIIATLAFFSP